MIEIALYQSNDSKSLTVVECDKIAVKNGNIHIVTKNLVDFDFSFDESTNIGINGKSATDVSVSDIIDLIRDDIYLFGNKKARILLDFTINNDSFGNEYKYINQLLYSLEN